jgi:small subunit ribosomal protein S20
MANTKSAKKAARQAERKTEVNKSRRSRTRTAVRKVEEAIRKPPSPPCAGNADAGDPQATPCALPNPR